MNTVEAQIITLFAIVSNEPVEEIIKLPQSGSDRIYYRIFTAANTFIATYNNNIQENQTFFAFTTHFKQKGLPVPLLYAVNEEGNLYIQEDAGTKSLLDYVTEYNHSSDVYSLFKQSLQQLAKLQILGDEGLSYNLCLTAKSLANKPL